MRHNFFRLESSFEVISVIWSENEKQVDNMIDGYYDFLSKLPNVKLWNDLLSNFEKTTNCPTFTLSK
jgi:hypothetical protein